MAGPQTNAVVLSGQLVEIAAIRYTPAGVPVLNFKIRHESRQTEAGVERQVAVEMQAVALGETAKLLAGSRPGMYVSLAGFLAAKSLRTKQAVLHVRQVEFVEGMRDGVQTETQVQG